MDQGPALHQEVVEAALSSGASRQILALCIRRPMAVKDISEQAKIPLPSAYRQVRTLTEQGLLVVERSAMTPDGRPYDLYRSRIRQARIEVTPDRVTVDWEPNLAIEDRLVGLWSQLKK